MSLLITVVWGTKGRSRPLGVRGAFCPGCLDVRKVLVYAIEQSDHVYMVALGGWKEKMRYQECDVCQCQVEIPPDSPMIGMEEAEGRSGREILETTQPPEALARIREAEKAARALAPEERKRTALEMFLAHQAGQLKRTEADTGGWVGLVFFLFIGLGIGAFVLGGVPVGIASAGSLLVLLFWMQTRIIHKVAEGKIEPRVGRFLKGTGIAWRELEDHVERDPKPPGRLRRHFRRSRYAPYREGALV